jgi:hypothetical protein
MAALYKWRRKAGASGPVLINITRLAGGQVIGYPSAECLRSAELFLLEQAQKGMKVPKARTLTMDTITEEDVNGVKRKLTVIGTRGRNQIKGMYRQADLPVLARDHKLSEVYVQAAHEEGHEGTITTLHRSRRRVWIVNGRALADSIRAGCTECRLKAKRWAPAEPQSRGQGHDPVGGGGSVRPHRVPTTHKEKAGGWCLSAPQHQPCTSSSWTLTPRTAS